MLNTTEILIHVILERKMKKIIALKSSEYKGNRKRRMRKRKNKTSIDEISPGLLIKQKEGKKCSKKNKKNKQKQKKNKSKGRN